MTRPCPRQPRRPPPGSSPSANAAGVAPSPLAHHGRDYTLSHKRQHQHEHEHAHRRQQQRLQQHHESPSTRTPNHQRHDPPPPASPLRNGTATPSRSTFGLRTPRASGGGDATLGHGGFGQRTLRAGGIGDATPSHRSYGQYTPRSSSTGTAQPTSSFVAGRTPRRNGSSWEAYDASRGRVTPRSCVSLFLCVHVCSYPAHLTLPTFTPVHVPVTRATTPKAGGGLRTAYSPYVRSNKTPRKTPTRHLAGHTPRGPPPSSVGLRKRVIPSDESMNTRKCTFILRVQLPRSLGTVFTRLVFTRNSK